MNRQQTLDRCEAWHVSCGNFGISIDASRYTGYSPPLSVAGWSSWQLVGLITRRSQVRVLSPQPAMQYKQDTRRGVEQLAARRAHNPKVTGSSPVPATSDAI
jgi:hypothetical protein